jgi:hypothetical protein
MARIYQPTFAAMILFIASVAQHHRKYLNGAVAVASVINASIVLGPMTMNPLAGWAYLKFYAHAPSPQMSRNLELFGRRPLGFCDKSITLDNPPPKPPKHKRPAQKKKKKHPTSATVPVSGPSARAGGGGLCLGG